MTQIPVIFLSGMGADERLFSRQRKILPTLQVIAWELPMPRETLRQYASRLTEQIPEGNYILCGTSFGGVVAQEIATIRPPVAMVLLSTITSPQEFMRTKQRFGSTPPWLFHILAACALLLLTLALPFRLSLPKSLALLLTMLAASNPAFIAWATHQLLNWNPATTSKVPTLRIHGSRDFILRPKTWKGIVRIPQAGHLANFTHAKKVNHSILQFLLKLESHPQRSSS